MNKVSRAAAAVLETGLVADLTHEGEGVVRGGLSENKADDKTTGKTVFVAGALPGERVSFRRRSFHKS